MKKDVGEFTMNPYDTPYFPVKFLLCYMKNEKIKGKKRVQIYTAFRFFQALVKEEESTLLALADCYKKEAIEEGVGWEKISRYLDEDFYFSPAFTQGSFDPMLLLLAITMVEEKDSALAVYMDKCLSFYCPEVLRISFDDAAFALDFLYERELHFWAALYTAVTSYESVLEEILPEFARIYWNDLHFSCGDFLLYDFLNQYFETEDILHDERYEALNQALVTAVLQAMHTDAEGMAMDVLLQLKRPSTYFSGLYGTGVAGMKDLPTVEVAGARMKKLLSYAASYELRNHLYDYHLEEDKTITFENWRGNLKWFYVQYHNVCHMAEMTFYAAELSRELVKKQYEENVKMFLEEMEKDK